MSVSMGESELSSVTQNAAPGHWRAVTGEIQPVPGGRRCRKEHVRTEEMLKIIFVWFLGLPFEPPQVPWAVARGAQHRHHWEGRRIVKVLPDFSENCDNSPRKKWSECLLGLGGSHYLSAPHRLLRCLLSVASLLPMNLSLGLFSCFLCAD